MMANTDYRAERHRISGKSLLDDHRIPNVFYRPIASRFTTSARRARISRDVRVNYRLGIDTTVEYLSLRPRKLGFIAHHEVLGPIDERMKAATDAISRSPNRRSERRPIMTRPIVTRSRTAARSRAACSIPASARRR